ncbi:hypothetical protein [Pantoea ananatis]|uniref:hypothetical protein n=1 Tax=Pantoea ananas TaxID=553 RepID=UPI0023B0C033|nr:hypothetical protein [Pantoea ananatis]
MMKMNPTAQFFRNFFICSKPAESRFTRRCSVRTRIRMLSELMQWDEIEEKENNYAYKELNNSKE